MNLLKYLAVGFLFGLVLTKSEAVSWYRIYEMFMFQSFHMYGIIGVAITTGVIGIQIIKRNKLKDIDGLTIEIMDKEKGSFRYWIGGLLFGLGWALTGACPGPLFAQIGSGFTVIFITFLSAIAGTWVYGKFSDKLPN